MGRKPKRPKAIPIGSRVKVRAIRGPHKDGSGRWYWRAEAYDAATQSRATVWTGWALPRSVEAQVAALVASGSDLNAPKGPVHLRTVRDLLECWLWHVEHVGGRKGPVKASSLRIYTYGARQLLASMAEVRVDRITRPVVEDYRDARLRGGGASATVASELRVLGHAYRWWSDRAPRPLPPFPRVTVKVQGVRNRYTPTRGEALAVVGHLSGWSHVAGVLLFATGARPGEVRDLCWGKLDLTRGEAHLDGKTGPRTVPLGGDVVRVLDGWRRERAAASRAAPGDTVLGVTVLSFNSAFGPRLLRQACVAAGVPVFTPYGLRRAAVNAMARAGVDVATAASVTGHSVEVMLRKYRDVTAEDRRAAVRAAGLGSLSSGDVLPFPAAREA